MKRAILLSFLVFNLIGCSSIQMRYDAKVKTEKGQKANYEYRNSYSTGSAPVICAFTFWFFGGGCWFYLVMPTVGHKNKIKSDAIVALEEKLKSDQYTIERETIEMDGWGEQDESVELKNIK